MLLDVIVLVAALVCASLAGVIHYQRKRSEPQRTVSDLFKAAHQADLEALAAASVPAWYFGFIRHFGEERYRDVARIYDRARDLGGSEWLEYRHRRDSQAGDAYEALHAQVAALGREAYVVLPVERRLPLTESREQYDAFVFKAGIEALPAVDRAAIRDPEAFRIRGDRDAFVENEGWRSLNAEDRAVVGDPAALSPADTHAKRVLLERLGLPRLDKGQQARIAGIARAELDDAEGFKLKHGIPKAQEFLRGARITVPGGTRCVFPAVEQGSLLRGEQALCHVSLPAHDGNVDLTIGLRKERFDWLVESVKVGAGESELYNVNWQASQ